MPAPTYTWMRHPSFPAGQAAQILDSSVAYWISKGWVTTTADTLGVVVASTVIPMTTMTHSSIPALSIKVPTVSVAFWQTRGWA